jgi:hypothetical protein
VAAHFYSNSEIEESEKDQNLEGVI